MAEGITIPSPSVFLAASPQKPPSPPAAKIVLDRPRQIRRPNQQGKKKKKTTTTTTTTAAPGEGTATADSLLEQIGKPKQSKSRNGCSTCKAKRLKCDEEKPGCQQCARRHVECGGYKKDFKWRPFGESNVKLSIHKRQKPAAAALSPAKSGSQNSQTSTPQSDNVPSPDKPATLRPGHSRKDSAHQDRVVAGPAVANNQSERHLPVTIVARPPARRANTFEPPQQARDTITPPIISPSQLSPLAAHSVFEYFDTSASSATRFNALSPTLSEILRPFDQHVPSDADFPSFDIPDDLQIPQSLQSTLLDPLAAGSRPIDDEIEEIVRDQSLDNIISRQDPLADAELDLDSWDLAPLPIVAVPSLAQDSPEMLSLRFDKLTCGILSVMDGPTENPWRNLIWPLAQESQALYHAITAMTAFHSSTDVAELRLVGHEHKQLSIRYIQEGIRDDSMSMQTAIATALALGFTESWDQHTASGNTHIKGAQALVKRALKEHQKRPLNGVELSRLKFLCNAWVYMDVIARLTSVDSDESNDFDNLYLFSAGASQAISNLPGGQPGFGIDFGIPIDARLDPLMGCAGTLFPIIGRVANLVRKVCRSQSNSPAVISQANDLKSVLENWDHPAYIQEPEDPSTQIMHSVQTAEAYRWATLLHLHQSVPEIPSASSSDLAGKVMSYLATVPLFSRTVIVHIYPLMVAGCEAWTLEDRQWVRDRWAAMGSRMRIGVIDKCIAVTEEVWQRKDAYEAQPTEQRKLVATAELQSSRARSQKTKRPHSAEPLSEPGRSGMVFTWIEDEAEKARESKASKWPERQSPKHVIGSMDPAYTVRGHLHWVGVMWDWGWEVLLG